MASSSPDARPIFSGEFRPALDGKNRITIPAKWRRGSEGDEFFLIKNPSQPCLTVMPPAVFQGLAEESKAGADPAKRRDFIRLLYSQAQNASSDKQGRLLVTEEQCSAASLSGAVVVSGQYDRFEIWSSANWEKFKTAQNDNYLEVAKNIGL